MSMVINGRLFDPKRCVPGDGHDDEQEHFCVHDWRCYWGNFDREAA